MRKMKNPIRIIQAWNLNRKQANIEKQMEKYGFTDEILDKQVEINKKRHELDISDKDKLIYEDFVQ